MSSYKEYLAKASAEYHDQMMAQADLSGVRVYLTDHAIMDRRIVEKYKLGYVERPLPGDEQFTGRIAIPYLTPQGVASLKYRLAGGTGSKYMQHKGQKPRLYNVAAYHEARHIIGLTEGEVDAIVATELVRVPTMGVPGSDGWQHAKWSPIFKDFSRVLVFTDGDDAGDKFWDHVSESIGTRARRIPCDPGQDVSSMAYHGKVNDLRQLARER